MPRWNIEVLLRPKDGPGPEQAVKIKITEMTELLARRAVLERAWWSQMLVVRFLSIKQRSTHE